MTAWQNQLVENYKILYSLLKGINHFTETTSTWRNT